MTINAASSRVTETKIRCPHCGQVAAYFAIVEPFREQPQSPSEANFNQLIVDYPWPSPYKARIVNACGYEGWKTFRDLCRVQNKWHILSLPNFGEKTLNEINAALSKYGMQIGMLPALKDAAE